MIFKIAHICYCGNIAEATEQLGMLGYKLFISERVRPMGITQKHLSYHVDDFYLSIWTRPGGISIECLEFEKYSQNEGLVCPLLPAGMPGIVPSSCENEDFHLNISEYLPVKFLGRYAYADQKLVHDEPILNSLLFFSSDIFESIRFWNTIGFNCIESSEVRAIFRLHCAFTRKEFFIHICRSEKLQMIQEEVNSPGFHILGLISNSATHEHVRMMSSGMNVTPTEQISINGRNLTIFYSRSPEGVLVEIISPN